MSLASISVKDALFLARIRCVSQASISFEET